MGATDEIWLLSTENMASVTNEWHFFVFYFILTNLNIKVYSWQVASPTS